MMGMRKRNAMRIAKRIFFRNGPIRSHIDEGVDMAKRRIGESKSREDDRKDNREVGEGECLLV